jgi:hypothetical protein
MSTVSPTADQAGDSPGSSSGSSSGDSSEASWQGGAGDWQVEPSQVREFAAAVAAVRADLGAVSRNVEELADPTYAPKLGTSPVGRELAEKFLDRLAGDNGLLSHLDVVLRRLDEFTASAERAAATYQDSDDAARDSFRAG